MIRTCSIHATPTGLARHTVLMVSDHLGMAGRDEQRPAGIVAFVFTDIEDSTSLWETDPSAMRADVARHVELIETAIARNEGVRAVEQGAGDSTVAAFARASDAVAAAIEMQVALHAEAWTSSHALRVRVAVHAGEVDIDSQGAYAGPTMNRCGRLLDTAHGGQVIVSSSAIDLARSSISGEVTLADLGTHHLRGIDDPLAIVQITVPTLPSDFPPLRTVEGGGATVPGTDSTFIDRDADLTMLARLLGSHRVVTIVGSGGCGKTRLAIEVARQQVERFRHGVTWVDLAPVASGDAVLDTAATALGLRGSTAPTLDRITGHLDGRVLLVVIDNCEHLLDASAALASAIEMRCPSVRVLATSREPLGLKDEVIWRVPSLAVPAEDGSDLLDVGAGRLLVDRIRHVRPRYEPDAADTAALASICRLLDGIPLALELAAAQTATISPVPLAHRLTDRFSMLGGGGRDVLARQRTLEASVAWSYQLLDDRERQALRRLSVFPGPFLLDAAVSIVDPEEPAAAERDVLRLIECSLLVDRTTGDLPGAQMLETIRWFARERLAEDGDADVPFGRHLDWFLDQATALGAQLETPTVRPALGMLERHLDDLRASMTWALDHDRALDAARIIAATTGFWAWRGRIAEATRWLEEALSRLPELDPVDELTLHGAHLGLLARAATAPGTQSQPTRRLLELARTLGDEHAEGRLLIGRSIALAFREPARAEAEAEAGIALCRQHHDRYWEGIALYSLALARITAGRFDLAEAALDQMRPLARSLEHPQLIADEIARRVMIDRRYGRYDTVLAAADEIDEITEGITDLSSPALVHAAAAFIDVAQGRASDALAAMEALIERYEIAGEHQYRPSLAMPMIEALIDLGRPADAVTRFEPLWAACRKITSWRLTMGPLLGLAHLCAGDVEAARAVLDDALDAAAESGNDFAGAVANRILAAIERNEGSYRSAEHRLHQALDTHAAGGYQQHVADVLEELAGIDLDHGRPQPAAILFGAASSIRASGGVTRRVGRQDAYEADLQTLRAQLDDHDLTSAWDHGARLTMPDAVDVARRGRGERGRPTAGWESLTTTEAKVADLVARGLTNPAIAEQLIMGRATVKTHVSSILRKLDLDNRTQLAREHARREPG